MVVLVLTVTVEVLLKSSALGLGCRLRRAVRDHSLCCVVHGHFFPFFLHGYTKLKCKHRRKPIPTVLLYERCEVALVFSALGDVNRTNGPHSGATLSFIAAL